jgi:NAD-dependent dihydropyrimidine dehydrogenase PreA subunit
MKRSWTNFALDTVIAAAFLLCAATGILFLLPPEWLRVLAFGRPGLLGVGYLTWHTLHDWSGVVATVGVVAHVGLHYRWISKMAGRLGRGRQRAAQGRALSRASRLAPAGLAVEGSPHQRHGDPRHGDDQPRDGRPGQSLRDDARRGEPRCSRRGFLAGAAATLGVAAFGGVGVLSRGATRSTAAPTASASQLGRSPAGSTGQASVPASDAGSQSTSGAAQTQVSVDGSACIACGRCLRVCSAGVFSWSHAGVAQASAPQRCIRCRRCVEACPASAITLAA